MMRALDRKLLRDFRRLWAQAVAIALVLACGVAILITSYGMYQSLEETRTAYYERNRFADLWADMTRAPRTLLPAIEAMPGVMAVEARVTGLVTLDVPGLEQVAVGRILSLPVQGQPRLNVPLVREGRLPDPDSPNEVAITEPFAQANHLRAGDSLSANLNGVRRDLIVTGTVLSPEYVYALGPGALMPDAQGFGIFWMPERAAAAAFDLEGAFNTLALRLDHTVPAADVADRIDQLLEPYGGLGTRDRSRQESDAFLSAEIKQLKAMAAVLPPIFYGIAAFLVNMVLGRIVALERSEIGLLKALGYTNADIALHYVLLAALTAVAGILVGWAAGAWLARGLANLYANFFTFPYLIYSVSGWTYAVSGLLGLIAAGIGVLRVALSAANLAPATAMLPPAPPRYRRNLADRAMAAMHLSQPSMMILRNIVRWPLRSGMSILGLAMAGAVLTAANFFDGAMDKMIQTTFGQANRQDVVLIFARELPETALAEVARLPGAMQAEAQLTLPVILRHGPREKHVAIEARRPGSDLSRALDEKTGSVIAPAYGVVLSRRLASELDAGVGDVIEAEFRTGRREQAALRVEGLSEVYFGLGAYMDFEALNALRRQAPRVTSANLTLDSAQRAAFDAEVKGLPMVAGTSYLSDMRRSFEDTIRENVTITSTLYLVIASLITVGVTYNGARILLSERARELASLRILGFTTAEVSFILVGELMLLAVLAQPIGWAAGAGIAWMVVSGATSDLYSVPLVMKVSTFTFASLIVLVTALAAALIVRRRLDTLDLVAVMKTRE